MNCRTGISQPAYRGMCKQMRDGGVINWECPDCVQRIYLPAQPQAAAVPDFLEEEVRVEEVMEKAMEEAIIPEEMELEATFNISLAIEPVLPDMEDSLMEEPLPEVIMADVPTTYKVIILFELY
jgi:hypothetical protein